MRGLRELMVQDKFQAVMWDSTFALILLANEDTQDWELIEPQPVPTDAAQTYAERGLSFAGVFGVVNGKPRSELSMPLEDVTIDRIAAEFVARFVRSITHPKWMCAAPARGAVN